MITGRFATPGKTRACPHCRATILDSATVCPGCHHHLRFDSSGAGQRAQPASTPLRVEGTLRHPSNGGAWEYSVVLAIRNDRGEEIARQVVGVGALQPGDARTFTLAVEVFKPAEMKEPAAPAADAAARAASGPKPAGPRVPARPGLPPAARPAAAVPGTAATPAPGVPTQPGTGAAPLSPGRTSPLQPLKAPQAPAASGSGAAPGRGIGGVGLQPKRS